MYILELQVILSTTQVKNFLSHNINNNQSRESFSKIFPKFFKTLRKRIRGGRKQAFGNFATNLFHGIERE